MPLADVSSSATVLVHIGARDDGTLSSDMALTGKRTILIQPDPDLASALRQTAAPGSEVLELAAEDGRATLLQMNFAALSSLNEPTPALHALLPGLRVTQRLSVETVSPASLLRQIGAHDQVIDLILDAPGSEMALLQAWEKAGALKNIRKLVIRCGTEQYFEGATASAEIAAWLVAQGFANGPQDLSDPDWSITLWQADPALRALKAALTEARSAAEAKTKALIDTEVRAKTAEEKAATLAVALTEARAVVEKHLAQLEEVSAKAGARHTRIKEIEAQLALAEKTNAALRQECADHAKQHKEHKQHKEQQHRLTLARNDLRRAEGQIDLIKDLLLRGETL